MAHLPPGFVYEKIIEVSPPTSFTSPEKQFSISKYVSALSSDDRSLRRRSCWGWGAGASTDVV